MQEPQLITTLFICSACFLSGAVDLALLFERVNAEKRRAERGDGGDAA